MFVQISSRRASAALVKYLGNAVTAFKVVVGCGERDPGPKPGLDTVQPLDFRKVMALLRPCFLIWKLGAL